MISSIEGVVVKTAVDRVVINIGGLGYQVFITTGAAARIRTGQEVSLQTYLLVKEDALTLFGFEDQQSRDVFETLLNISGVGPRTAMAILSMYTPAEISAAAAQGHDKTFSAVPGIGPKGARRIVLELAGKLVPPDTSTDVGDASKAEVRWFAPAVEALENLGWSQKDAGRAVERTLDAAPEIEAKRDLAELIKETLRYLGSNTPRA